MTTAKSPFDILWELSKDDMEARRKLLAMQEDHNNTPTAGEWTPQRVQDMALEHGAKYADKIATAHNASIAAEKERYDDLQRSVMDLSHPNCKGLLDERNEAQQQLAAEQQQRRILAGNIEHEVEQRTKELRKQLAAEQEQVRLRGDDLLAERKAYTELSVELAVERKARKQFGCAIVGLQRQLAAERESYTAAIELANRKWIDCQQQLAAERKLREGK